MGSPGPVQDLRAEESTSGIALGWTAPEETGFGPGGEALLQGYKVRLSRCASTQTANCGVATFHVPLLPACNATALDRNSPIGTRFRV